MFVQKQQVLYDAPNALNRPEQPWQVSVEGNAIVARWKWMDATFFAPAEISDEIKAYQFTVTLDDKGKWKELDQIAEKSKSVQLKGGGLSFGTSSSSFKGKTTQKSFQLGVGKDNQTGDVGIVAFKFDTNLVKQSIRDYLTHCGWKKAGMFG